MRQLKIATQITNRDSQAVEKYLQEISKIPMITPEEETVLAQRIKMGDQKALDKLVQANLRFVVSVAKQYQHQGLSLSDLINEGNLGLIKAAQRFDETKGFKFISYAVWWIRQSIMHALAAGGRVVRLPVKQAEMLAKLRQEFEAIQRAKGTDPTVEELARALEIPPADVADLLRVYRPQVSLDAPLTEEGDMSRLDSMALGKLPSSEEAYVYASMAHEVQDLLGRLEPRQATILRERFGLEDEPKSLAEIGRELGLSRERVRQIEAQARRQLYTLAKAKALDDYLN